MITIDESGKKHYYYYKKKIGCHKKPGPKPRAKDTREYYLTRSISFYKPYARKYKSKEEFKKCETLLYECCSELNFIDILFPYGFSYKKSECVKLCKGYNTSDDLIEDNFPLYEYILKCGWLADIFPYRKEPNAYAAVKRNGWSEIVFNNKHNNGYKYMKSKKIYKIDVLTMKIVDEYNKVSEITNEVSIYRVLNGEKETYKDGYIYRKDYDISINDDGSVIDLLQPKSKSEKRYNKYEYTIDLLKNSNFSISEICELSRKQGIKICEATCRQLQKEYALKELE